MEIYNTFSGLGYNSLDWNRDIHEITSIEYNEHIAKQYHINFPLDKLEVTNALTYLEEMLNNEEWLIDHKGKTIFIWCSPPCQSHTMFRMIRGHNIPQMDSLYGLITFLEYRCKFIKEKYDVNVYWIVENVKSWYKPLIEPTVTLGRHRIWSNFDIPLVEFISPKVNTMSYDQLNEALSQSRIDINYVKKVKEFNYETLKYEKVFNYTQLRQLVRNGAFPPLSRYILELVEYYDDKERDLLDETRLSYFWSEYGIELENLENLDKPLYNQQQL
jgi:DNA (cytosine-5)-methyltransferase 1